MSDLLLSSEPLIRVTFFLGILAAMAAWEAAAPRRRRDIPRLLRWTNNLGVVVIDTTLVRLTFPLLAVGLALMAEERGWGLFNVVGAPVWAAFIVSVLALDLAIYLQHVMFHAVPALWRLHRMHHADLEFDVSTGLRFHPVEILLSMGLKSSLAPACRPTIACPVNCCHQVSVCRSYMIRSEFRSSPVVPKSSVRPSNLRSNTIEALHSGQYVTATGHTGECVVDDLVPGQDAQGIGPGDITEHQLDDRLAIRVCRHLERRLELGHIDRRYTVPGQAARNDLRECHGGFREIGFPSLQPPHLRIRRGGKASGDDRSEYQKSV
jgi:hypothetical protein